MKLHDPLPVARPSTLQDLVVHRLTAEREIMEALHKFYRATGMVVKGIDTYSDNPLGGVEEIVAVKLDVRLP